MIKKHQPLRRFPDYKSSIVRSPENEPLLINFSNSEITGPLFNKNILNENDNNLILNFSKMRIDTVKFKNNCRRRVFRDGVVRKSRAAALGGAKSS